MSTVAKFNSEIYRNRNQITLKTGFTGIRAIYRWCEFQKKYVLPKTGLRYVALVKQGGIQKEKSFERKEEALKWRTSGEGVKISARKMTFEEVMAKYFAHIQTSVTAATWKTYKNSTLHLEFFFKIPVSGISSQVIDQWLAKIKMPSYLESQHQTRFTYAKELKVLKQILKYYSEYENDDYHLPVKQRHNKDAVIDFQRMKASKMRNQSRYLDSLEQTRFLEELKIITGEEKKIFFYLAFFQLTTGTRIGEAGALKWNDIDMVSEKVSISKSIHWGRGVGSKTYVQPFTKTGVARKIPMTADLKNLLMVLNQEAKLELVFTFDGMTPLEYRSIQYFYNKAFERAGINQRSTHILRHTFSTDYLSDTKDHVALSRILGHSSTRQTEHYAKITGALTDNSFKTFKEASEVRLGKVLKLG